MQAVKQPSISARNEVDYRRPAIIVGLITLVFTVMICLPLLLSHENGVLAFAHIGTRFSEGDIDGTKGYDGQFSYFIARDGAAAEPFIDGPTLRYQRILYPVLARALALCIDNLVPWALLLINIAAHSLGAAMLAYILARLRAPAFGALIYSFWIGSLFAIRFDLNEPLCFALALAAIIAYMHERYRWTVFLLMLSVLAKELGLVFAAGIALHAFWRRQWGWSVLIFAGPALQFFAWWGVMRLWFGSLPTQYPAAKIHLIPFEGMFSIISGHPRLVDYDQNVLTLQFILVTYFIGVPTAFFLLDALWRFWRTRTLNLAHALVIPAAGFVMVMPDVSWHDQVAVYRVALPVIITGIIYTGVFYPQKVKWLAGYLLPAALIIFLIPGLWTGGS